MTENWYTTCPELAQRDPYQYPLNEFPPSAPVSPPSEISSPNQSLPARINNLASSDLKKDLTFGMATAAEYAEHHRGISPVKAGSHYSPLEPYQSDPYDPFLTAQPSDPEQGEFDASAFRLTSKTGAVADDPSSVEGADCFAGQPQGCTFQDSNKVANLGEDISTLKVTGADSAFLESPLQVSGLSSGNLSSIAAIDTKWLTSETVDPTLYTSAEYMMPSPSSMPEVASVQHHLNTMLAENTLALTSQDSSSIEDPSQGPPRLTISTDYTSIPMRGRSPIITISATSRGDSPEEQAIEAFPSSSFLSPSGHQDGSINHENRENDLFFPGSASADFAHSVGLSQSHADARHGLDPHSRGHEYGPSPNEIEAQLKQSRKNEEIDRWQKSVSEVNSDAGDEPSNVPRGRQKVSNRIRALSTGDRPLRHVDYFNLTTSQRSIVGPGLMVHESSEESNASEDDSEGNSSPDGLSLVTDDQHPEASSPPVIVSSDLTGSPKEAFPMYSLYDVSREPVRQQPQTSAFAMAKFEERAREQDAASITATIDQNSIRNLSLSLEQSLRFPETKRKTGSWSSSSLFKRGVQQAQQRLKRQASDLSLASAKPPEQYTDTVPVASQRKESTSSSYRHRLSLSGRHSPRPHTRSPSLTNAIISMTGKMAAVGGSHSVRATSPQPDTVPKGLAPRWGRDRAKSELPRPSTPGLFSLMQNEGGPPVANLAPFHKVRLDPDELQPGPVSQVNASDAEDNEETEVRVKKTHPMEFPMPSTLPVPSKEGFKSQIMQLNPRLCGSLIDRFADEQVRRHRKLVEYQQAHTTAISRGFCESGEFCFAVGGQAKLLAPNRPAADGDCGHTQYRVLDDDDAPQGTSEGIMVAAAQLPAGVPFPPVARLPAVFECNVCFQVKEIKKPSDWSKHVYEDVQPFTCTFPDCTEPKSFKRKADWVRHENERHRQPEWWTCSIDGCAHRCFRKNNFIQHLKREHKFEDSPAAPGIVGRLATDHHGRTIEQLVEECKHTAGTTPAQESCPFCDNHCSSIKKLTAHVAKHMEQLAMPVLRLVMQSGVASNQMQAVQPTQEQPTCFSSASFGKGVDGSKINSDALTTTFQSQVSAPLQFPELAASAPAPGYSDQFSGMNYTSMTGGEILMEPEEIIDPIQTNGPFEDQCATTVESFSASQTHPPATMPATLNLQSHARSNLHAFAHANVHAHPHPLHQMSVSYPPLCTPRIAGSAVGPTSYSVSSQLPPQALPTQQAVASAAMGLDTVYSVQQPISEQVDYQAYRAVVPPTNPYVHVQAQYDSSYSSQMG
ncbi:hypothetical protein N7539_003084 [Penicillium diatomitis]|uniref:C2H2-type domain-containing protein n=1 Tax=Penicillium diatomitis TaxID=2819901 RepID=A0A9X0BZT4_9EURO|nr:uncharacterized protein N7539_003084 [Penicillium diatomitis]KAJ5491517.1 hypothetical protein N7539_003084 [Penicillium diatomitis]